MIESDEHVGPIPPIGYISPADDSGLNQQAKADAGIIFKIIGKEILSLHRTLSDSPHVEKRRDFQVSIESEQPFADYGYSLFQIHQGSPTANVPASPECAKTILASQR